MELVGGGRDRAASALGATLRRDVRTRALCMRRMPGISSGAQPEVADKSVDAASIATAPLLLAGPSDHSSNVRLLATSQPMWSVHGKKLLQ